jgi:hypothetical protein
VLLEPDKQLDSIFTGEAAHEPFAVLVDAAEQI